MKLHWQPATGGGGELLYAGRIRIGFVEWSNSHKDGKPWKCSHALPGMQMTNDRHASKDEAKARLERAAQTWFSWTDSEETI